MKPANIELNINELTLTGFPPFDHFRLSAVVEAELTRLFAEQGVPSSLAKDGLIHQMGGGAFIMEVGSGVEYVGAQVARSLYRGFPR